MSQQKKSALEGWQSAIRGMTAPTIDEQIAFIRPFITGIPHGEMFEAILATLQSVKDAGDDVVEPELWGVERDLVSIKDYDTLLSAYKRACVERDGRVKQETHNYAVRRAEKAEAELAAMYKSAEEEAGHEMGLWPMGALAVVARLKSERDEFKRQLAEANSAIDAISRYGHEVWLSKQGGAWSASIGGKVSPTENFCLTGAHPDIKKVLGAVRDFIVEQERRNAIDSARNK